MSPTRFALRLLTALFIPAALLIVLRAGTTTYPFDVDLTTYDVEPQLRQRSDDRIPPPMPRGLRPTGAFTLN